MKQVIQTLGNRHTSLIELPAPRCPNEHVLVRARASLISLGTEKMLVEFGLASTSEKARKQPDKVKMVLEKARTDGVVSKATIDAVEQIRTDQ